MRSHRRFRFFVRRSPKLLVPVESRQIIVPFKPISILIIVFLLIATLILALRSDLFLIHRLDVNFQTNIGCLLKEEVSNNLDVIGRSLVFLNPQVYQNLLLGKFICLKAVHFEKHWPDKLKVTIVERKPVAALQFQSRQVDNFELLPPEEISSQSVQLFLEKIATSSANFATDFYIIDSDGLIFKKTADPGGLPVLKVTSSATPSTGQHILGSQVNFAVGLLSKLTESGFEVSQAQLDGEKTIDILLKDGLEVKF